MSLEYINSHPRDDLLIFDEPSHTYTVNGEMGYSSATEFVHSNFPLFDTLSMAQTIASKQYPLNHKYYNKSIEQIIELWNINKNSAADAGTVMHAQIEDYYNNIFTIDTLPDCIEMTYFKSFIDHVQSFYKWKPYRTEWRVFHEELKLAGTIDMVFINEDKTLSIVDWKRCKLITKDNIYNDNAYPTNTDLIESGYKDTNFWHYSLQLNLYKYILETKYNKIVKNLTLINLHPDNNMQSYEMYEVAILNSNGINSLIQWRHKQLRN